MAIAALLLVSAAACGKTDPSAPAAEGAAAQAGSPEDDSTGPKLAAAIECLNRHSGRVFETRDAYLERVDPATGAVTQGDKPALLGLYGVDACRDDVKKAGALTPAVAALDSASAAYVTALEQLVASYDALKGYYEKGEHLDDSGKKAAELHPKLMAAFEGFARAHQTLDAEVNTLNRARRVADLAAREKAEGRNLEVIIDTMMLEAESLVEMLSAKDGAALDAQITTYGKLVDEVDAYAGAHADEVKRGSMANLRNYSMSFLAAAKVIGRKLRDGAEPTDAERGAAIDQYNSLVTNYNNH
jgi:hypothetical protein